MIATFKGENAFLSNFYLCKVNMGEGNGVFPSSEHAYMSFKSDDEEWKRHCRDVAATPAQIKEESRKIKLVEGWDDKRLTTMFWVLTCKFQDSKLAIKLVSTGKQNLQEGNYHGDIFWGIDLKVNPNIGENHLGRLLMKIRSLKGQS